MFGDHASYIVSSYLVTALVVFGLIAWIRITHRRHKKELKALDAKGVKRASAK